jgi:hypothetical protein
MHEKGGNRHEMPAHHKLEHFVDEYLVAAGIREDGNRMPVVLAREAWPAWLGEEPADEAQLKSLLAPYPSDSMVCWPVSARVAT